MRFHLEFTSEAGWVAQVKELDDSQLEVVTIDEVQKIEDRLKEVRQAIGHLAKELGNPAVEADPTIEMGTVKHALRRFGERAAEQHRASLEVDSLHDQVDNIQVELRALHGTIPNPIVVREGASAEDLLASVAVSVARLVQERGGAIKKACAASTHAVEEIEKHKKTIQHLADSRADNEKLRQDLSDAEECNCDGSPRL